MNTLLAVSPVDGRYSRKTKMLQSYFSEWALFKYRVQVEVEYLIALSVLPELKFPVHTAADITKLRALYLQFAIADAERIKEIETVTNHDVKAVEYFIKEKVKGSVWENCSEMIHFGLTSQDINNTAVPLSLKDALNDVLLPELNKVLAMIEKLATAHTQQPMLARTHGQAASPTTFGKEMRVFSERLSKQMAAMLATQHEAKFGGATGNFNAHRVAFPGIDWPAFANHFCSSVLGLQRQQTTTQIEHYDTLAALFDCSKRINVILIDFCRDIWTYVSLDYLKQKIKVNEVGSSAMPHKVNPIDFENAEGNLGIANALFIHLAEKLPISRLQRDLTDSTVLRNIGVPFAHTIIALQSIAKGLSKIEVNANRMNHDLENNWLVIAEAIQTILRRENVEGAYEMLKDFTRNGNAQTTETMHAFIDSLPVNAQIKDEMKKISPRNYTGYAALL